jgi:hypothetical protein
MDEITINITLLDRPYRLSVARADEEKARADRYEKMLRELGKL